MPPDDYLPPQVDDFFRNCTPAPLHRAWEGVAAELERAYFRRVRGTNLYAPQTHFMVRWVLNPLGYDDGAIDTLLLLAAAGCPVVITVRSNVLTRGDLLAPDWYQRVAAPVRTAVTYAALDAHRAVTTLRDLCDHLDPAAVTAMPTVRALGGDAAVTAVVDAAAPAAWRRLARQMAPLR